VQQLSKWFPCRCSGVKHHSPQTVRVWNDADASELLLTNLQEVFGYAGTSRPNVSSKRKAQDVSVKRLALIIGDFCGTLR